MKIVLIGFMGSGKSLVAHEVGRELKLPVLECDQLITTRSGLTSVREIFALRGEPEFRRLESLICQEIGQLENAVISCGGGVVERQENINFLRARAAIIVYLKAKFDTIGQRLAGDTTRPLFQDIAKAKSLYLDRQVKYERNADLIIETDGKDAEQIAAEILSTVKLNQTN